MFLINDDQRKVWERRKRCGARANNDVDRARGSVSPNLRAFRRGQTAVQHPHARAECLERIELRSAASARSRGRGQWPSLLLRAHGR